jgi:hypothetical protein
MRGSSQELGKECGSTAKTAGFTSVNSIALAGTALQLLFDLLTPSDHKYPKIAT